MSFKWVILIIPESEIFEINTTPLRTDKPCPHSCAFTGDVLATRVMTNSSGNSYYLWDVKPHRLVSATAVGSRVFILVASSNPRQWKKFESEMRIVRDSFDVPERKPDRTA